MFNKVILVGNLTRDVELRYLPNGSSIGKFGIATNRKWKDQQNGELRQEVMFIDVSVFGRSAEIANQYLKKGSKVLVEGRLALNQWTDQTGQKRSKHEIVADSVQFMETKPEGGMPMGGGEYGYTQAPSQGSYAPQQQSTNYNQNYNNDYVDYGSYSQQPQQQNAYQQKQPVSAKAPSYQQQPQQPKQAIPEIDIDDEDIPF